MTGYLSFNSKISGTTKAASGLLHSIFLAKMKHVQIVNNVMVSLWGNSATVISCPMCNNNNNINDNNNNNNNNNNNIAVSLISCEYNINLSNGTLPRSIRPDMSKLSNRRCKDEVYSIYLKIAEPSNYFEESGKLNIFIPKQGKSSVNVYFYKRSQYKTFSQFYKILIQGMEYLSKKRRYYIL